MRRIFILIIYSLLFSNYLFSQSGWFVQNSNTDYSLHKVFCINDDTVFACGENGSGQQGRIFKTTNGGNNWVQQITPFGDYRLYDIYFPTPQIGYSVGDNYTTSKPILLKTTDQGLYWLEIPSVGGPAFHQLRKVFFTNANVGYLVHMNVGGTMIYKTTNGGLNWMDQMSGGSYQIQDIYFINQNTGYAAGYGGKIYRTTNGSSWINVNTIPGASFTDIYFLNNLTGYLLTNSNSNQIYKTTNGGLNCISQSTPVNNHALYGINFVNAQNGWIVGPQGKIIATSNGGINWISQSSGVNVSLISIFFSSGVIGYTVGSSGTILKTTTGGNIILPPIAPVLVLPANGATLVATNPLLDWDSSATAESYRVQVSTDSLFTSAVYDSSGITITQFQIPNNGLNINTTYYWRVNAKNIGGTGLYSSIFHFTTGATIVSRNNIIPREFRLYNNYPNPFNPFANIKFDMPKSSYVKLIIYDVLGKEINTLVNEKLGAGSYEVSWDGSGYPSGVYFYRLITDEFVDVKKMVLLK